VCPAGNRSDLRDERRCLHGYDVVGQDEFVGQIRFVVVAVVAGPQQVIPDRSIASVVSIVTRSPTISAATQARMESGSAYSRWLSLTRALGAKAPHGVDIEGVDSVDVTLGDGGQLSRHAMSVGARATGESSRIAGLDPTARGDFTLSG
jgi:hypothetical protein